MRRGGDWAGELMANLEEGAAVRMRIDQGIAGIAPKCRAIRRGGGTAGEVLWVGSTRRSLGHCGYCGYGRGGARVAGTVARTGVPVNIPDAYRDERFHTRTDKHTG